MNIESAVITGATGFIGSRLAKRLLGENVKLTLITRAGSNTSLVDDIVNDVEFIVYDGTYDSLEAAFRGKEHDAVFHLASLFSLRHEPNDIAPMIASNITLGTQTLEASTRNGCGVFVNAGTFWQHFENQDYSPVCLYAATKQAFEDVIQFYVETADLRAVTIKLNDTYGPGDPRKKLFALLLKTAATMKPFAMSPGQQLIDVIHVDDAVEAFVAGMRHAVKNPHPGHARFAASSGAAVPLRELVAVFEDTIGQTLPIEWGGLDYRPREVMRPWDRGTPPPGWNPRISLEEGIRQVWEARDSGTIKSL